MKNSQSGNVLVYILIAVALLAALSFAIAQSGRGGVGDISKEKAKLLATEIIEYGNILNQTVSQVRLRGYKDTEISFENTVVAGYTNANCTDDGCKIFNVAGGGVRFLSPPPSSNDGTDWVYTSNKINDVGNTSEFEIMMILQDIDKTVCEQLNNKLHGTIVIPQMSGILANNTPFTGTYNGRTIASAGIIAGKYAYCFEGNGTFPAGTYHYFQVLLPR